MEHDEDDLIGDPIEEVPKREPGEECNARRSDDGKFVGYCNRTSGWGTESDDGRCRTHGGSDDSGAPEGNDNAAGNDGGAPEENTNAVKHGAYAEHNSYYQDVLDDDMREFVDDVFEDYLEDYKERHGDPVLGIESELFRIAVTHAKDIGLDRWAHEKPDGLDSGHPLVDKETEIVPIGEGQTETQRSFRESVVQAAQKRLSTDRRTWLKDLGLLDDPESAKADAISNLKDAWKTSAQDGGDPS